MSRIDIGPLLASLKSRGSGSLIPQSNGLQNVLALIAQQQQSRRQEPDLIGPALIQAGQQFSDNQFKGALVREQQQYQSAENEANRIERHNEAVLQQQSAERMANAQIAATKENTAAINASHERVADKNLAGRKEEIKLTFDGQKTLQENAQKFSAAESKLSREQQAEIEKARREQADTFHTDEMSLRTFAALNEADRTDAAIKQLKDQLETNSLTRQQTQLQIDRTRAVNGIYSPEEEATARKQADLATIVTKQAEARRVSAQAKMLEEAAKPLPPEVQQIIKSGDMAAVSQLPASIRDQVAPLVQAQAAIGDRRERLDNDNAATIKKGLIDPNINPAAIVTAYDSSSSELKNNPSYRAAADSARITVTQQVREAEKKFKGDNLQDLQHIVSMSELSNLNDEQRSSLENKLVDKYIKSLRGVLLSTDTAPTNEVYQKINDLNVWKISRGYDPIEPEFGSLTLGGRAAITGFKTVPIKQYQALTIPNE